MLGKSLFNELKKCSHCSKSKKNVADPLPKKAWRAHSSESPIKWQPAFEPVINWKSLFFIRAAAGK